MQIFHTMFSSGNIDRNLLQEMFGSLQNLKPPAAAENLVIRKMMSNPVVLSEMQTPYGRNTELWRVLIEEAGVIWTSGCDNYI